jgi:hypothetical protein
LYVGEHFISEQDFLAQDDELLSVLLVVVVPVVAVPVLSAANVGTTRQNIPIRTDKKKTLNILFFVVIISFPSFIQ